MFYLCISVKGASITLYKLRKVIYYSQKHGLRVDWRIKPRCLHSYYLQLRIWDPSAENEFDFVTIEYEERDKNYIKKILFDIKYIFDL